MQIDFDKTLNDLNRMKNPSNRTDQQDLLIDLLINETKIAKRTYEHQKDSWDFIESEFILKLMTTFSIVESQGVLWMKVILKSEIAE